jgi:small subunit ribosomal protein S6
MPLYEHVFMARQDVSQTQVEALIKEFADVITAGGGKIGKTEYWGLKNLAYKIKKNRKAHYSLMNIEAPPAAVAEMERRMGLSPDVLRFLTIKVEQHETEMSIQMRKQDRDDRDRDRGFGGDRGGGRFGGRGGDRGPRRDGGGGGGGGGDRGPRPDRPPMGAGAGGPGGNPADRGTFRPRPRDAGAREE